MRSTSLCLKSKWRDKLLQKKTRTGNLFTVLTGSGSVEIDGNIYDVKKGDSFILTTHCSNYTLKGNMFLIGSYDR